MGAAGWVNIALLCIGHALLVLEAADIGGVSAAAVYVLALHVRLLAAAACSSPTLPSLFVRSPQRSAGPPTCGWRVSRRTKIVDARGAQIEIAGGGTDAIHDRAGRSSSRSNSGEFGTRAIGHISAFTPPPRASSTGQLVRTLFQALSAMSIMFGSLAPGRVQRIAGSGGELVRPRQPPRGRLFDFLF